MPDSYPLTQAISTNSIEISTYNYSLPDDGEPITAQHMNNVMSIIQANKQEGEMIVRGLSTVDSGPIYNPTHQLSSKFGILAFQYKLPPILFYEQSGEIHIPTKIYWAAGYSYSLFNNNIYVDLSGKYVDYGEMSHST